MSKITANNDKKRNRILFDFESIIDLKLSYIRKYLIESGKAIIEEHQMDQFKFNHMYIYQDPLSLIPNLDRSSIDLDHPEAPVFTGMRKLLSVYLEDPNKLINASVLCKDEQQQRIIKEFIPRANKILVAPRNKVKVLNFSRIILADPRQTLEFRNPITVDFMVLNFRENFSENDASLIDPEVLMKVCDVNKITIAKAYPDIPEPVG